MSLSRLRSLMPYVVGLLLLAGSAVLAVLQVSWVSAASEAEEERARTSLTTGAVRVRIEAEDEIRVLLSLLRVSALELAAGDWSSITDGTLFWRASARFPELLRSVYVARLPLGDTAAAYNAEKNEFVAAELPSELREGIEAELERLALPGARSARTLSDGSSLLVLPIYRDSTDALSSNPVGAVAATIDPAVFYRSVIPSLMEEHLKGYPFRVVDASTGRVAMASGGVGRGRTPEVSVELASLFSYDARLPAAAFGQGGDARRGGPDRDGDILDNPSLRYWLLRGREQREVVLGSGPLERGPELQVFYPNKPLGSVMQGRRILGIAMGLGILSALLGSGAVLYGLYRRSARMRASEQEFVASMSHELRTPIAVIQATSENLAHSVVTDPARLPRYARVIHDQVKRLADMVESILFYSGLQADPTRSPTLAKLDLQGLIEDVVRPLSELAARRGSSLAVRSEGIPQTICSDAAALRMVLENLLTNAIRHADPGEIKLTVMRKGLDSLRITVEDCGPGIAKGEQAGVFEPFVRGERSIKDQRQGSGLGLHLVSRIAAMLGGSVELESPYPNIAGVLQPGCRFTVTVPCREDCGDA